SPHCILFILILLHILSSLFPYTTLFRSSIIWADDGDFVVVARKTGAFIACGIEYDEIEVFTAELIFCAVDALVGFQGEPNEDLRSEEHTSELQSRENLVCRLLLEKKKTK